MQLCRHHPHILAGWNVSWGHSKDPLCTCGDILTLFRPFGLIPLSNGDRDAIPNHNSALLFKYSFSLFGFHRFTPWWYPRNCITRRCVQLFGRASFGIFFARCGGLREETFVNLYIYNSVNASTDHQTSYIYLAGGFSTTEVVGFSLIISVDLLSLTGGVQINRRRFGWINMGVSLIISSRISSCARSLWIGSIVFYKMHSITFFIQYCCIK